VSSSCYTRRQYSIYSQIIGRRLLRGILEFYMHRSEFTVSVGRDLSESLTNHYIEGMPRGSKLIHQQAEIAASDAVRDGKGLATYTRHCRTIVGMDTVQNREWLWSHLLTVTRDRASILHGRVVWRWNDCWVHQCLLAVWREAVCYKIDFLSKTRV
jgi:hypothetical protein